MPGRLPVEVEGELPLGETLQERYDHLAALVAQLHRRAAEGLAGITSEHEALTRILDEAANPCCARVNVRRASRVLLERIAELQEAR